MSTTVVAARTALEAPSLLWRIVGLGERILAGFLLILVFPFLALAGLAVVMLSNRSPLIAHQRLGKYGRPFWVVKLRTMWNRSQPGRFRLIEKIAGDPNGDIIPKKPGDPRITSCFALFCRRYSIDELPQLWHVLRGDMALIGPRPLTEIEIKTYYKCEARELLSRKPGISGLWQVRGRSTLTYKQRRRLDLFMIRKWQFRLYLRLLLETVPCVFGGKDAW